MNAPKLQIQVIKETLTPAEMLDDYIDHLCAPMVGVVPYLDRIRFRDEATYHVEELAKIYENDGLAPDEAMENAIQKYGKAQAVGQRFIEEWFSHKPDHHIARKVGLGNLIAFFWFGQATLWSIFLIEMRIFLPDSSSYPMISPVQMRQYIPEPFPVPDTSPWSYLLLAYIVVAPIIAGWFTGKMVPVKAARSVYNVMVLLTLATFALGVLMLPMTEGLLVALFQMIFWLPIGSLTAHFAAAVAWRRRCALYHVPTRRKS